MTDKLAEEIIEKKLKGAVFYGAKDGIDGRQLVINAMQAYHEAKLAEITDEDIEVWANSKEKIIDEMPETLKLHITKKIECRIEGAKAFRDGKIVSSNN